jgi:uncharacterized protein YdgA (DUF945 family)
MGGRMKKLVAVIGAVAIVGVSSYPLFGMLIEKELRQQIQAAPTQYGMSLSLKDFQRHWFYSQAKVVWDWHIPAHLSQNHLGQTVTVSPKNFHKEFNIDIQHGPVVLKPETFVGVGFAKTTVDWPFMNQTSVEAQYDKSSVFPKVTMSLATNFLLKTRWKTNISDFKLISKDTTQQLLWNGMVFENLIDANGKRIQGDANLTGFDLVQPDIQVNVKDVESDYDFTKDKVGLYVGHAQFDMHQLRMVDKNQQEIQFQDLTLSTQTDIQNQEFTTQLMAHFDKMILNKMDVGPFDLDLKLEKVNAQVLSRIHQLFQQEQNASPSFRQKNLWSMMSNVPDLLKYGMVIHLNKFHVALPDGIIDSQGTLDLPLDESGALNIQRLQTLKGNFDFKVGQDLLKNWLIELVQRQMEHDQLSFTQAASSAEMKSAATSRISEKLAVWVQSGVLKAQSSEYVVNIQFHDGQLLVNNLPFDPAWLMI